MSASNELEKAATAYALDAVRLDKQGQKGRAITIYQKAIESLLQLVQLYPEYGLNKVYVQRAIAYQERIKALQGSVSSNEMNEASNSDGGGGGKRGSDCDPHNSWLRIRFVRRRNHERGGRGLIPLSLIDNRHRGMRSRRIGIGHQGTCKHEQRCCQNRNDE